MTGYRGLNEAQYACGYWGRWPAQELWLDNRIRTHLFSRWLRPRLGDSLLDLGGGAGNFSDALAVGFSRVVLSDIAHDALRQNANPAVGKVQADLLSLPFPAGSFDKILLADVLEHLEAADLPRVLAEVHRISRPGAIVAVFTNCRGLRLRPMLLHLRGRRGRKELDWKDLRDGHLNRLRDRELSLLIEKAGFRIRRKRFFSHFFEPLVTAALEVARPRFAGQADGAGTGRDGFRRPQVVRWLLALLTGVMALDLLLLGRVPGGGVFMALERP